MNTTRDCLENRRFPWLAYVDRMEESSWHGICRMLEIRGSLSRKTGKKRSGGVESWQVLCERQKSLEVIQKNTLTYACVESKRYNEYDEYEKLESF